jgi:hypothetical protein
LKLDANDLMRPFGNRGSLPHVNTGTTAHVVRIPVEDAGGASLFGSGIPFLMQEGYSR